MSAAAINGATSVVRFAHLVARSSALYDAADDIHATQRTSLWAGHMSLVAEALRQPAQSATDRAILLGIAAAWTDVVIGEVPGDDDREIVTIARSIDSVLTDAAALALDAALDAAPVDKTERDLLRAIRDDLPADKSASAARERDTTLDTLIERERQANAIFNAWHGDDGSAYELAWEAAFDALERYEPRSPDEFVRWMAARFNEDLPFTEGQAMEVIALAHKLAGTPC
jgi:hypothetical protein